MLVVEFITDKVFDQIIENLKGSLKEAGFKIEHRRNNLQKSLLEHNQLLIQWMNFINFKELRSPQSLTSVYVDLDIQLTPRRWLPEGDISEKYKISEIINRDFHLVILGDVGAGKTTTLQHICKRAIDPKDETFISNSFPLLIRLRNLDRSERIWDELKRILGIRIVYIGPRSTTSEDRQRVILEEWKLLPQIIIAYLEELYPILIIDGFDEIPLSKQKETYNDLNELFLHCRRTKIVLSCRSGAFEFNLEYSEVFELCPLDGEQQKKFVYNWLDNDDYETKTFFKQLNKSPFSDTAIRPLTLAHLCALYKKYKKIPAQPKSIYKKIVNLLLEDWDLQRGITRTSSFSNFEVDKKLEFLYRFAYEISSSSDEKRFTEETLFRIFDNIHNNFGVSKLERRKVINEIEAETGLLIKISHDFYEFAHLSIQEYLTAEYIVHLPKVYEYDLSAKNIMNELAIAISLSSNSSLYFATLVVDTFPSSQLDDTKVSIFLRRLFVENPDFSSDVITAVGIIYIYTLFFTIEIDGELFPTSNTEVYEEFWSNMLQNKNIEASLLKIKDTYWIKEKKNGLNILTLDYSKMRTGFNYPKDIVISDSLFDY